MYSFEEVVSYLKFLVQVVLSSKFVNCCEVKAKQIKAINFETDRIPEDYRLDMIKDAFNHLGLTECEMEKTGMEYINFTGTWKNKRHIYVRVMINDKLTLSEFLLSTS